MDGDLYLEEEFIDDTPPDFIPENGEEPPRKLIKRRKVHICFFFLSTHMRKLYMIVCFKFIRMLLHINFCSNF